MSDTKQKALDFFKSKPETKEVFATKDGFLFTKKQDATTHAVRLNSDNPEVETFENEALPAEEVLQDEKLVQEYEELFKEKPGEELTDEEIQELIDAELDK